MNKQIDHAIAVLGHAANEAGGVVTAAGMSPCGRKWAVLAIVAEPEDVDAVMQAFDGALPAGEATEHGEREITPDLDALGAEAVKAPLTFPTTHRLASPSHATEGVQ
jgi:hypothetical protein